MGQIMYEINNSSSFKIFQRKETIIQILFISLVVFYYVLGFMNWNVFNRYLGFDVWGAIVIKFIIPIFMLLTLGLTLVFFMKKYHSYEYKQARISIFLFLTF